VADLLNAAFGLLCGREPSHMWSPGGVPLPFCQRCAGFYAGAAVALALHVALRIRPGNRFLLVHGGFLLLMVPFGYHWVPQNALVRALSGVLFGAGVVSFLWLFPGPRAGAGRPPAPVGYLVYATGIVGALALVPGAAAWGGLIAWRALVGAAALGLAGIAALLAANAGLGLLWLRSRRSRAA
jgi:uncharacterized membrane protein